VGVSSGAIRIIKVVTGIAKFIVVCYFPVLGGLVANIWVFPSEVELRRNLNKCSLLIPISLGSIRSV
jgi:hypothetical protein